MPLDTVNNGDSGSVARAKINASITQVNTNVTNIATLTSGLATANTNISTNTTNIATNTSAISTLQTTVSGLVTAVNTHTGQIATLTSDVAANTADIVTNTSDISSLTSSKQSIDSVSTLFDDVDTVVQSGGSVLVPNTGDSQFVVFTGTDGSGATLDIPDDATNPQFPIGKHYCFWNHTDSIDDVIITPAVGVTVEYAGALTSSVLIGEYCELVHIAADTWVRIH